MVQILMNVIYSNVSMEGHVSIPWAAITVSALLVIRETTVPLTLTTA